MTKTKSKALSLVLSVAMAIGMMVPAFAAEDTKILSVSVDGMPTQTYEYATGAAVAETKLFELGSKEVESVTIQGEYYNVTNYNFDSTLSDTMAAGTSYSLYMKSDTAGTQGLYFMTNNGIMEDVSINVNSIAVEHTITANSGAAGTNDNYGTDWAPTCTIDKAAQTVAGEEEFAITFTPTAGNEITQLNIRRDHTNNASHLVTLVAGTNSHTVDGHVYSVTKNNNGVVTLRGTAFADLFVTALTTAVAAPHTLTVTTDTNCTSDVTSTTVSDGTSKTVVFTPNAGYSVTSIYVTDGTTVKEIKFYEDSAVINGKTYRVQRDLNGKATLTIPEMKNDISVHAYAANTQHTVRVIESVNIVSGEKGVNVVNNSNPFAVTFTPRADTVIKYVTCKTAKGAYTAYVGDAYFVIEGQYYPIYYGRNDSMTIQLNQVRANMEFYVNGKNTRHNVTTHVDNGCKVNFDTDVVNDGENLKVVFTPKSTYTIKTLKINYNGGVYTANVNGDGYVRVNGARWNYTVDKNGVVTLEMVDIEANVTVTASTNYAALNNLRITKTTDGLSNITFTGTNPFNANDSTTVTVKTINSNYILKTVTFRLDGKSVSVGPFDKEFTLNGVTYQIDWETNAEMYVKFNGIPGNLTISSTGVRGTVEKAPVVAGPVTTPETPSFTSVYHAAYMRGYGNGNFGADMTLTRAEAVTLLARATKGVDDSMMTAYSAPYYYIDVPVNAWYAGYVNYAAMNGYLTVFGASSTFSPTQPITRAEFLALLCVFQGIDVKDTSVSGMYSDVQTTHPYAAYIAYATSQGWVGGYGNGMFGPDSAVTRAQICKMVNHVMGRTADYTRAAQTGPTFNDVPITHWAFYEIFEASHSHSAIVSTGFETWN